MGVDGDQQAGGVVVDIGAAAAAAGRKAGEHFAVAVPGENVAGAESVVGDEREAFGTDDGAVGGVGLAVEKNDFVGFNVVIVIGAEGDAAEGIGGGDGV